MSGNGSDQVLVFIGIGDEVGFAVDFHEGSHFVGFIDIAFHDTFGRYTACLLGSLGQSLLSQVIDSFIHVSVRCTQGLFAVHHAGTGTGTQFFYETCSDLHRNSSSAT